MTRLQDDSKASVEQPLLGVIVSKMLIGLGISVDFTQQQVGYLQFLLQEAAEINGRTSSVANEKSSGPRWRPLKELELVKSVSDKLGASLIIDTETPTIVESPRGEGSRSIMVDPTFDPREI